jgi:hypothetical protein
MSRRRSTWTRRVNGRSCRPPRSCASTWFISARGKRRWGRLLGIGAPLILYGPYRQHGVPTAESNEVFDVSLKSRNPAWGLRHVEDVSASAVQRGLALQRIVEMPANNLTLVFRRG